MQVSADDGVRLDSKGIDKGARGQAAGRDDRSSKSTIAFEL